MDIEAPVPASEARMVQDNLRVLVVCTVQPDKPVRTTERYSEATFHDPTEMMLTERHLRVNATELWVFDTRTGKVYSKTKNIFY
ncbi:MAG TPA: hypothetical protein VK608_04550 [Edaphobacter sp.]|nr:hypothetical protein [Edaphobacter sp.]